MPSPKEKAHYSVQDILELPEGERAELINGVIYNMATPSISHQAISGDLYFKIRSYLEGKDCRPFYAPCAVYYDDVNWFEPDLFVVCDPDKIADDQSCKGAPDWILEVVSPSTEKRDYGIKLWKYKEIGVREYWIVDPTIRRVSVYYWDGSDDDIFSAYSFDDEIPVRIYNGDLIIRLADYGQ